MNAQEQYAEGVFPIGTIVALKSHPFSENLSVVFGGDPQHVSPLMVVCEVVLNNKFTHDEHSGIELSNKHTHLYRCTWFSSKNYKFEEEWLSGRLLKKVCSTEGNVSLSNRSFVGANLVFRTLQLESKKLKTSLNGDSSSGEFRKKLTALMDFVSPIMQFSGTLKFESKEPIFDPKTQTRRRFVPSDLVKCKYYNPHSEKFSEYVLPVECLVLLPEVSEEKKKLVDSYIQSMALIAKNELVQSENGTKKVIDSVLIPKRLVHKFGMFFLECFDCYSNNRIEIQVDSNLEQFQVLQVYSAFSRFRVLAGVFNYTDFSEFELRRLLGEMDDDTKDISTIQNENSLIFRIRYRGVASSETQRIVRSCNFRSSNIKMPSDNSDFERYFDYMEAYCHLRQADRNFRTDRIVSFEVLCAKKSDAAGES
jgi:hypothetical protein